MAVEIRESRSLDLAVMGQVDRSEKVAILYEARPSANGLGLELHPVPQEPVLALSNWSEQGIQERISKWQPEIEKGGKLLVAYQGDKVVGFGLTGPVSEDGSAELCALFVSTEVRKVGVGSMLFERLESLAKEQGAQSLLIYSNPTQSAVEFYLKQNCTLIGLADKRLVRHLPWDVVFAKQLSQ